MRRARRTRGATLVEILISLAVVLVGMLAMFRTLATSVNGSSTASKLTQAQQRAVLVMESIRTAPTTALDCLVGNVSSSWGTCEAGCRTTQSSAGADACLFTTLTMSSTKLAAGKDVNQQNYYVVTSNATGFPVTAAKKSGVSSHIYEAQIVIGWRDDNTTTGNPDHTVVLRSGVFSP